MQGEKQVNVPLDPVPVKRIALEIAPQRWQILNNYKELSF